MHRYIELRGGNIAIATKRQLPSAQAKRTYECITIKLYDDPDAGFEKSRILISSREEHVRRPKTCGEKISD